ncbi:MAG: hypothetical protein QG675_360 [Patescibacteria group bacterium]|nr:hypothetical protein [Patescibacteria group bacterium]
MNKPSVLYHASPNRKIEIFEPRAEHVRDPLEGPVVFATPDIAYASCFIVESDDSWVQISGFNNVRVVVISDRTRFEREDQGGAIYELPSDTFVNEIRGGAKDEWTSREAVKPITKNVFDSGLDAMLKYAVQVYFVDQETFDHINIADDHGIAILRTLKSENQERNINVCELPKGDFNEK